MTWSGFFRAALNRVSYLMIQVTRQSSNPGSGSSNRESSVLANFVLAGFLTHPVHVDCVGKRDVVFFMRNSKFVPSCSRKNY